MLVGVGSELVPVLRDAEDTSSVLVPMQREGAGDGSSAASLVPVAKCFSQQMDFYSHGITVR